MPIPIHTRPFPEFSNSLSPHIDYLRSMENRPASQRKGFPYYLAYIYIEEPSVLLFDYWCTGESVQLEVVFEYKAEEFCLRRFGVVGGIPDHWEDA